MSNRTLVSRTPAVRTAAPSSTGGSTTAASASIPVDATIIAIDGPAASGKSSLGAALAAHLGYVYFDSGVAYRALTWAALDAGVAVEDGPALATLGRTLDLRVVPPTQDDGRQYTVQIGDRDITWAIRTPAVDRNVSPVSAHPAVRAVVNDLLRRLAGHGRIVMVGRDIGTAVLPHAGTKLYLDASLEERARRRVRDRQARGELATEAAMLDDLRRRDAIDSGREADPLRPAADAVLLDSSALSLEEVLAYALQLVRGLGVRG